MYIYGRPLITYDLIARGREAMFFSLFERHPYPAIFTMLLNNGYGANSCSPRLLTFTSP